MRTIRRSPARRSARTTDNRPCPVSASKAYTRPPCDSLNPSSNSAPFPVTLAEISTRTTQPADASIRRTRLVTENLLSAPPASPDTKLLATRAKTATKPQRGGIAVCATGVWFVVVERSRFDDVGQGPASNCWSFVLPFPHFHRQLAWLQLAPRLMAPVLFNACRGNGS